MEYGAFSRVKAGKENRVAFCSLLRWARKTTPRFARLYVWAGKKFLFAARLCVSATKIHLFAVRFCVWATNKLLFVAHLRVGEAANFCLKPGSGVAGDFESLSRPHTKKAPVRCNGQGRHTPAVGAADVCGFDFLCRAVIPARRGDRYFLSLMPGKSPPTWGRLPPMWGRLPPRWGRCSPTLGRLSPRWASLPASHRCLPRCGSRAVGRCQLLVGRLND